MKDMARQARQVEAAAIIGFVILLLTAFLLWQYKIELTAPAEGGRIVTAKINIFELLLEKR